MNIDAGIYRCAFLHESVINWAGASPKAGLLGVEGNPPVQERSLLSVDGDATQLKTRIYYVVGSNETNRQPENRHEDIETLVEATQAFFATEMVNHRYAWQTFKGHSHENGELVKRLTLPRSTDAYHLAGADGLRTISRDISRWIHEEQSLKLFFINTPPAFFGPGLYAKGFGLNQSGGYAVVFRPFWDKQTLTHEIGHAMGLWHDYRAPNIMGAGLSKGLALSEGAAAWMRRQRAFNAYPEVRYGVNHSEVMKIKDLASGTFESRVLYYPEQMLETYLTQITF